MELLAKLISLGVDIYVMIIVIQVAVSWLIAFDVINPSNIQAQNLIELLKKLTDPIYKPLRKFIPAIGGIDLTPLIVIIGLSFLRSVVLSLIL